MGYLLPAEYAAFGLSEDTAEAWVTAASAMMEAHCRRATLMAAIYTERLRPARGRASVRLSYGPVLSVDAVKARYAPVRGDAGECWRSQAAAAFGLPGAWTTVDVSTLDVSQATDEVGLGENLLGLAYSEVEVTYTAGLSSVPDAVKVACAQIVRNAQATPALNVRTGKMDALQMQYFSDSLIDSQVRALLRPYVAERLGQ